ncbi:hypothetical protein GPALN_005912 [Globodera pallida]|nr:hypothetical protein GPALN_005912 [Globodera pallida]
MRSFAVVLTILALFAICYGMWPFGEKEDTVGGSTRKQERAKKDEQRRAEAHQNLLLRQHEATMQSVPGFDATAHLPNQSQSTRRTVASYYEGNLASIINTRNPSSENKGKNMSSGSSAMLPQQVPMPGTSFPSFPNYPSNQSAPLNSSTNFALSQPGTPSLDRSGGNSQNNEADHASMFNTRKRSSSKDKNATKPGKKPRK